MKELVSKYPGITSALGQLREEKVTQVHLLNSGYSQLFLHVIKYTLMKNTLEFPHSI